MEVKINYRHLESSDALEETIRNKVSKLKKFFSGKMNVEWTCSLDGSMHASDVTISGDHFSYHAKAENNNLYKTVDEIVPKLERQLSKRKEQTRSIIHKNARQKDSE